ncbi:MAG: hypothetical protein KAH20_12970 [Methylococcales bacterium]|nr:hypothetical protein [Methylococcales bacterium]
MQNQIAPNLFLYTALECEAKPLINRFNLKKECHNHPFSVYRNQNIILTVSGVGKIAMAGAIGYTQALFQTIQSPVLINLGIAGHKYYAVGDIFLATKIVDSDSGKRFYPQLIGNDWPKSTEIHSSSIPCTKYSTDYMNDMEASAFYETAIKFSSNELIHSLKIVSDNEQSSIEKIRPKLVTQWINHHSTQIEYLLNHWISLQQSITNPKLNEFDMIVSQCHFTVSSQIKLKSLLLRWQTLSTERWLDTKEKKLCSSKEVLQKLEFDVNNLGVHL